uniref:Uncharacterized protein n=1 Tax=Parascaris univalens TaxID=6257 RepID=A0A915BVP8_PARUN
MRGFESHFVHTFATKNVPFDAVVSCRDWKGCKNGHLSVQSHGCRLCCIFLEIRRGCKKPTSLRIIARMAEWLKAPDLREMDAGIFTFEGSGMVIHAWVRIPL